MSDTISIGAGLFPPSSLTQIPLESLCSDFLDGFCRQGDDCHKSHQICAVPIRKTQAIPVQAPHNFLSFEPRGLLRNQQPFESDGPGILSVDGPRHDNDHVNIEDIRILPTVDEILCLRKPYIPKRSDSAPHALPLGERRLLDILFRQLRYDSVEQMIDACYHATQHLVNLSSTPEASDYEYRHTTPKGSKYSLFRALAFEDLNFDARKGLTIRISFACPMPLRGRRLGPSSNLEEGMLVALIGLDAGKSVSTTFMEIQHRQTTEAMKKRSKNDLRASLVLSFAETDDCDAVHRMLYNFQGYLEERFILVEFPSALYAGFQWTLKNLQRQATSSAEIAFLSRIAPSIANHSPKVTLPRYATADGFEYNLDDLIRYDKIKTGRSLRLSPRTLMDNSDAQDSFVDTLCEETTLDRGQAYALCQNLYRDIAFTQGPPGTGKTFLGSMLVKVLLASRDYFSTKPILVVCMTNHALDNFLTELRNSGVTNLARLGSNSKQSWTKQIQIGNLTRSMKQTSFEKDNLTKVHAQIEALTTEGTSWCASLNTHALSWPAVRDLLRSRYPAILTCFTDLEDVGQPTVDDIRLARKAGGFAFEYWCSGGDLRDISNLLDYFTSQLKDTKEFQDDAKEDFLMRRERVLGQIFVNAENASKHKTSYAVDVWSLGKHDRTILLQKWETEIDTQTILDRTAEIHRRHQLAMSRRHKFYAERDARCLAERDVIGCTTTACAREWYELEQLNLQTILCEEAGEVTEAQTLCSLFPTVEHAIWIGDPLQLRPQINEPALSLETKTGEVYRLDESLMERMLIPSTPGIISIPFSQLSIQRRMHPAIADLMRVTQYPYLLDHESTNDHKTVAGMSNRIWWLDHSIPEDVPDPRSATAKSFSNAFEVEMVTGLVEYLIKSNEYDLRDITILTPYNGQLAAFTRRLVGTCSLWLTEKDRNALLDEGLLDSEIGVTGTKTEVGLTDILRLATIDNFQGEESKVVILSTVRSNDEAAVGFLKTPNRINVGCSRAREGFYVVGNSWLMRTVDMWDRIINDMTTKSLIGPAFRAQCSRHQGSIHEIQYPQQWYQIPECQISCGLKLPCGHSCTLKCHTPSLHDRIGCAQPCLKYHERCGHRCIKTCGQSCGDCEFPLSSRTLPCGHEVAEKCGAIQENKEIQPVCNVPVEPIMLSCGHSQGRICSTKNQTFECIEVCNQNLQCGHRCQRECRICTIQGCHTKCTSPCGENLGCGHQCIVDCHKGECPPCRQRCLVSCNHGRCSQKCGEVCDPCTKPCGWACAHQGSCTTMCCLPCNCLPCSEPCTNLLVCGHLCPSICGEDCPIECSQCLTGKVEQRTIISLPCNHKFELQFLDNYFEIARIYEIDSRGRLASTRITSIQDLPLVKNRCPICGVDCMRVRRYSAGIKFAALVDNLDCLYAISSRRLNAIMRQTFTLKARLDQSIDTWRQALKPGQLSAKSNKDLVINRESLFIEVEGSIRVFTDNVTVPLENGIKRLEAFLNIRPSHGETVMTPSYTLRFAILVHRVSAIILEEKYRMRDELRRMQKDPSEHTQLMMNGMRHQIVQDAEAHLARLSEVVEECRSKNLKRLEVEARLVQLRFHTIIRNFGITSDLDVEPSFEIISELCRAFPLTAGLLKDSVAEVKRFVYWNGKSELMYGSNSPPLWWSWPQWHLGDLQHCKYGHPYSGFTWGSCPECGDEVEKPTLVERARSNSGLQTEAFRAWMMKERFNR